MSRWFRFYDEALDDPKVQRLSPEKFKAELEGAMRGQVTAFTPFLKPGLYRLSWPEWAELRAFVFERDDYVCTYCGERGRALECDHIVPVSRGGSNDLDNLTTACQPCNRSKRAKLVEEWRQ